METRPWSSDLPGWWNGLLVALPRWDHLLQAGEEESRRVAWRSPRPMHLLCRALVAQHPGPTPGLSVAPSSLLSEDTVLLWSGFKQFSHFATLEEVEFK